MPIIRIHKRDHPFVQIDKRSIDDPRLSWKAKGLLVYLLSKPNDWKIYVDELKDHATDGRDSTMTAINTLEEYGYIEKDRKHNDDGTFAGFEYIVKESPELTNKAKNGNSDNGSEHSKGRKKNENNQKTAFKANETINGKTVNGKTIYGESTTTNIDNTNKDKTKNIPPLQEVKDYFIKNGFTEQSAEKAFNYYQTSIEDHPKRRYWRDSKGNKIKNWKMKMQSVWFKDENKIATNNKSPFRPDAVQL